MACNGGDDWGCGLLGHLHETGEGVRSNAARARELYGIACKAGHPTFCDSLQKMSR